jgi:hypothetical protein
MAISIELEQCPQPLQDAVNKYLADHESAKILVIKQHETTPYKDKTITQISYRTYLEWGNLLTTLRLTVCSKEEWNVLGVTEDSMVAGDMAEFIDQSWWFRENRKVVSNEG